ncbi:MAG: dependent oxidoreductase [Chloroflexi bacterium]|nr:dependent oxidoreductase [Chloroflexota bacterium]
MIGAGQAGLTMSWFLQRAGRDHVVLERRSTLGGGWQDRWDEFRLVSPNWTASFPGAPYDGKDTDGFMPRDELIHRVAGYARTIGAPVVLEAGVDRLRPAADEGFLVETTRGPITAREVIVAAGGFHVPHVPPVASGLPNEVLSLHSHHYRRADDLPPGAVLVVGSGQSGVQLVEELKAAGRDVFLSVGSAGRAPRRYRGRDLFFWLWSLGERGAQFGTALPSVDKLPDPRRRLAGNPHLSGHAGGHETNLREMGRSGVTLLGRVMSIDGGRIEFGDDLRPNLAAADRFFAERFRGLIDAFIAADGLDCPPDEPRDAVEFEPPVIDHLDLGKSGVTTVLWTSGYRQDLGWIDMPVADAMGFPRQVRGVSDVPGLYFIGSLWQHDQISATLFGLPRDARVLAERMGLRKEDDAPPPYSAA